MMAVGVRESSVKTDQPLRPAMKRR
jgi:hypothetical protein